MRRARFLAASVLVLAVVSGCAGNDLAGNPTEIDLVAAVADTEAAGTGRFTVEGEVSYAGVPLLDGASIPVSASGEYDTANRRSLVRIDLAGMADALGEMGVPGDVPEDLLGEMVQIVDGDVVYLKAGAFGDLTGTEWVRVDLAGLAEGVGLDPATGGAATFDPRATLQQLRAVGAELEVVGRDRVDGVATTQLRAEVSVREAIDAADPEVRGLLEQQLGASAAGTGLEQLLDLTYPVEVWVGDDGLVRRVRTEVVIDLPPLAGGGRVATTATVSYTDLGEPVDIQPPPEQITTSVDDLLGGPDADLGGLLPD